MTGFVVKWVCCDDRAYGFGYISEFHTFVQYPLVLYGA